MQRDTRTGAGGTEDNLKWPQAEATNVKLIVRAYERQFKETV